MDPGRVPDDRLVDVANVPGEDDLLLHAALLHPHLHAGRAQQVSRIHKADLDPFKEFYDLSILRGDQMLGHLGRIGHSIKGLHRGPARLLSLLVFPLGILLLNVGRVLKHHRQQLAGETCGKNLPLKPLFDQQRNPPRVVNVGMGDNHIVDIVGGKIKHGIVPLIPALLQAAVNENLLPPHLYTVAAAGDGFGRAEKGQFHGLPSLWIVILWLPFRRRGNLLHSCPYHTPFSPFA